MPWTMPPWTWPSTIIGLMTLPKSSAADELDDVGLAGLGVDLDLADVAAGREGEVGRDRRRRPPSGRAPCPPAGCGRYRRRARSRSRLFFLSVPATFNVPFSMTMSPSAASIICAAIFLALASTLSSALTIADMPTAEREP